MHCDALNATVTVIRIHGCNVYDSHIKAAGCVVAFDVVYLQSTVIDAFFDLADVIITVRSLIRQAWGPHRGDSRPVRRP